MKFLQPFILFFFLILSLNTKGQYRYNYLLEGQIALSKNNYSDALKYFNCQVASVPDNYEGYFFRSVAKYGLDDLVGAELDITKAINIFPAFPKLYMIRAIFEADKMNYASSLDDFKKCLSLEPGNSEALYYRAGTYLNIRDYGKALADCDSVIAHNKKYENIYIIRGMILGRMGRKEEAIDNFCKGIEADKLNLNSYVERGAEYMEMDKPELAMKDFEKVLEKDSMNTYAIFERAQAKMKLKDYKGALKDLNRVIELSPDNELAYFNRAVIESNEKQSNEALSDYFHLLKHKPDNILLFFNMGLTLYELGNIDGSIKAFDEAIKLYPDYAEAYLARSNAKLAKGDKKGAKSDFDKNEELLKKNAGKTDSVKFKEGLTILKLTHFTTDFSVNKNNHNPLSDVKPKTFYNLVLDEHGKLPVQVYQPKSKNIYGKSLIFVVPGSESSEVNEAEKKIKVYDSLLFKGSKDISTLLGKGLTYQSEGQYLSSLQDFDLACYFHPENPLTYFCRANARMAFIEKALADTSNSDIMRGEQDEWIKNSFDQILKDYGQVISMDSVFAYVWYNMGYARFLLQDYTGASDDFANASKISGNNFAHASFNRGLLLIFLGRKDEGCSSLSTAGEEGMEEVYDLIKKYCN